MRSQTRIDKVSKGHNWSRDVTASTLDSESSDRGSNPRGTFTFLLLRAWQLGRTATHTRLQKIQAHQPKLFLTGRKNAKKKATQYQSKVLIYAPTTSSQCLEDPAIETEPPKPPFGEEHFIISHQAPFFKRLQQVSHHMCCACVVCSCVFLFLGFCLSAWSPNLFNLCFLCLS